MNVEDIKKLKEAGIKLDTLPHKKIILKLLKDFLETSDQDNLPSFEEVSNLEIKISNSLRTSYSRRTGNTIVYKQVKIILSPIENEELRKFLINQIKLPEMRLNGIRKADILRLNRIYTKINHNFILDLLNWYMFKLFGHYIEDINRYFYIYLTSWLTTGKIEILFQFELDEKLINQFNDNLNEALIELGLKKIKNKKIKKRTIASLPKNTEIKNTKYFTMISAKYRNKFKGDKKNDVNENPVEENL